MPAIARSLSTSLSHRLELSAIFILGLLIRITFIYLHPPIYGGDTLVRVMNADRILLAYQLPLLQLFIYLVNLVSSDPLLIRYLMSLFGALAGTAFYLLSATLLDRLAARLASLFFVFSPFLIVHSIVPYQEILMLLTLCLGLHFLLSPDLPGSLPGYVSAGIYTSPGGDRQRSIGWASLLLGLACLTRYEAWVINAAAGLYYARVRFKTRSFLSCLRLLIRTGALFGWAPLLWIVLNHGISPQGTYVLEGAATWERLWRIPYVTAMALYHAGPVVSILAGLGLLTFWNASLWRKREIQMILASASFLLLSLVFSAHGVGPDPQRYVTDREAHWFVLFPFWLAALGMSSLKQRLMTWSELSKPSNRFGNLGAVSYYLLLALAAVWGTFQTDRYIKRLLLDQNLNVDYAVVQHLERKLPHGSTALIFAQPLPPDATQGYLDKVYSQGGTAALDTARRQLADLNSGPLDYSRIVVNTGLGKNRILDASKLAVNASDTGQYLAKNRVRLAVVFSNYPAQDLTTRHLLDYIRQSGEHQATLEERGLLVSIYEVRF